MKSKLNYHKHVILVGDRLKVGHHPLEVGIVVRVHVPQPISKVSIFRLARMFRILRDQKSASGFSRKKVRILFKRHSLLLSRAIIKDKEEKILVCRNKGKDYYFFHGGHIEFGESSKQALQRELREELGLTADSFTFFIKHRFAKLLLKVWKSDI